MNRRSGLVPRATYFRDARLFVVAVEGEREEPWYFDGLRGLIASRRIRLVVLPSEGGLSAPEHVAGRLTRFEADNQLVDTDPRWLVVDVDRHHNLVAVLNEADREGWQFAVSNPCFEVWLQLHLRSVAVGTDSQSAKTAWRRLRLGLGEWPFERAHVEAACERSRSASSEALWVPTCPGTNVHHLVEALLALSG